MSINVEIAGTAKSAKSRTLSSSTRSALTATPLSTTPLVATPLSVASVAALDIATHRPLVETTGLPEKLSYLWDRWKFHYQQNSRTIVSLAVVNVLLTIFNEFAGRSIYTGLNWAGAQEAFVVWDAAGEWSIHRQSMVNILMTLFLSLAGGPIHFLKQARDRFLFFTGMAVLVSFLSQGAIWLFVASTAAISLKRLAFDVFYSSTIKYPVFEIVRPWVLRHRQSFALLFCLRYSQDFALSMIRIGLLILIGLEG